MSVQFSGTGHIHIVQPTVTSIPRTLHLKSKLLNNALASPLPTNPAATFLSVSLL